MHRRFEAQVARTPDAAAVSFEGTVIRYRELNARANQLAHRLQRLGVGPDVLVGLCTERSLEQVVGILGILKAGGAYLPLDPAYPPDRIEFKKCSPAGLRAPCAQPSRRVCAHGQWRSLPALSTT